MRVLELLAENLRQTGSISCLVVWNEYANPCARASDPGPCGFISIKTARRLELGCDRYGRRLAGFAHAAYDARIQNDQLVPRRSVLGGVYDNIIFDFPAIETTRL